MGVLVARVVVLLPALTVSFAEEPAVLALTFKLASIVSFLLNGSHRYYKICADITQQAAVNLLDSVVFTKVEEEEEVVAAAAASGAHRHPVSSQKADLAVSMNLPDPLAGA